VSPNARAEPFASDYAELVALGADSDGLESHAEFTGRLDIPFPPPTLEELQSSQPVHCISGGSSLQRRRTAMTVTLDAKERELLVDILNGYLKQLLVEIRHTDNREFKAHLRERERIAENLLRRLQQAAD
jgi:hypothetical protein